MQVMIRKDNQTKWVEFAEMASVSGQQGAQGPAGAQGPQGLAGQQGPQGAPGAAGAAGSAGPAGAAGVAGPAGAQGAPGGQGPQGVAGPSGGQGVQGAQGAQGVQGAQGAQGPAGTAAVWVVASVIDPGPGTPIALNGDDAEVVLSPTSTSTRTLQAPSRVGQTVSIVASGSWPADTEVTVETNQVLNLAGAKSVKFSAASQAVYLFGSASSLGGSAGVQWRVLMVDGAVLV